MAEKLSRRPIAREFCGYVDPEKAALLYSTLARQAGGDSSQKALQTQSAVSLSLQLPGVGRPLRINVAGAGCLARGLIYSTFACRVEAVCRS